MTTTHRFRDSARYWRTPLLPGADLLTAEYRDHEFAPHWHDAYTIPVIVAGAECYRYRGEHYVAEAGSVPIINPGELHTGSKAVEAGWRYRVIYAPVEFMHDLAAEVGGKPQALPWFAPGVIRDPDLAMRLACAHRLLEAGDDELAAEAAMLDALSTLLVRYAQTRPEPARLATDDVRVALMQERLAGDLLESVPLAEVAKATGLSPFHAARLFTRTTGLPPHAWRNQVRLQRSLAPLRAGIPVTDVAAASGFTDQSHFTRHFRRMFGVPPGQWQGTARGA
ncbi:AraC family transcriptional regulator [Paraburkholderia sp. Ac-20336]|uniref:helix-turn-helix transcriptional regulator n=1 Tax=Burkholderiaceae TaxID=119060 RepID=UPI001422595F|nr:MULTISPECIES: AraC family transcriptional regulator [Burkholderiaceae]MBN3805777.1 AraC family transcriptional regulator [Paraburkholderia sp. Ac-20336]MBN3851203.1 AraC family transcriptional regulator [Paraburkholderia sp. Ac-20342]NIF53511.1 AraC family transcriptional regulator [Burkholderia sp. Ax-1724]NIF81630.1 AraC family transcriptional regulator [Paraburkholderia sp. Cy-641]